MTYPAPGSQEERALHAIAHGLHAAADIQSVLNIPVASLSRACQNLRDHGMIFNAASNARRGKKARWQLTQMGSTVAKAASVAAPPRQLLPGLSDEGTTRAMQTDFVDGSHRFLQALIANNAPAATGPAIVRVPTLGPARLRGTIRQPMMAGSDPRPLAMGRDPCPRCGTRGDQGCIHFQPCEEPSYA